MTDDLGRLLGSPAADTDERLKAVIRRQTLRTVGRRRWVRRGGKLATAAGLFLAGLSFGWVGKPGRTTVQVVRVELPAPPPEVVTVPVLVPVSPPKPPPPENPYRTADRLEQAAEQADDPAEAARLYRLAGDTYLTDAAEPGQAARCYRLFLQHAGSAGLAVDAKADSWLLMSLKSQRKREVSHVTDHGL